MACFSLDGLGRRERLECWPTHRLNDRNLVILRKTLIHCLTNKSISTQKAEMSRLGLQTHQLAPQPPAQYMLIC